jgi:5-formyltetrahydrofolate cyclo-ligase
MPLVGWDRQGGRLGMGGGFYDRALAGIKGPLLVGLAHAVQEVPQVPIDDWDVPLDFVVTESALHQCRGKN